MKRSDLERTLSHKLHFASDTRRQHITYMLRVDGRLVLPQAVRLSHGSGELTDREKGSAARDLCLKERELESCVQCEVDAQCVYTCMAIELLWRIAAKDPEATSRAEMSRDLDGVGALVTLAESHARRPHWSRADKAVLDRVMDHLDDCMSTIQAQELAGRLLRLVSKR